MLVEEVVGARTSEGACDVIDVDVDVVSTITAPALLEDAAGTGTAAGGVDRTVVETELGTAGAVAT